MGIPTEPYDEPAIESFASALHRYRAGCKPICSFFFGFFCNWAIYWQEPWQVSVRGDSSRGSCNFYCSRMPGSILLIFRA